MSAYDADDLLERARAAEDRDIPTIAEVTAELAEALDELERRFPDGRPRGSDGRTSLRYSNLVRRVRNCRWQLENGQAVEFPRGRRSGHERAESEDDSWEAFLAEHPELEGKSPRATAATTVDEKAPMCFTDAELMKALRQACRDWDRRFPERRDRGVYSSSVAWILAGADGLDSRVRLAPELRPSTRDVTRVGVALARLAREGRVERTNRKWEDNRWVPAKSKAGSSDAC